MDIASIPSVRGAFKRRKRVGRGIGSGRGKTSGRGQKGQKARTGSRKHPGFEGSRSPLIRRFPKRGFRDKSTGHEVPHQIVNVEQLNRFKDGEQVTPQRLEDAGLIEDARHVVKLLGDGALKKRLSVSVHQASEGAKTKVVEAGGTVELVAISSQRRSSAPVATA